jgi:hypothetical protein
MKQSHFHLKTWLTVSALTGFLCLGTPAIAQSASAQNSPAPQGDDATRQELANFDRFLDSHPETAEQVRKDPSFVNNEDFLQHHPALQTYLQDHPAVRQQITADPNALMRMEARYDRREDDRDRGNREELAHFDQFLDTHRETAEQLRKDPSLVDNEKFVSNHPALQSYLREHPELREQLKQNPNSFLHQEERYDRREDDHDRGTNRDDAAHRDGDRDRVNREELAHFDQFLDTHRETAEQLRKDPSPVDNQDFLQHHPALQTYLQDHTELREQIKSNPNAFMQQEARYDNHEGGMDRDGTGHRQAASFGEFLGGHSEISQRLAEDPSLVKNQEYMENHPELKQYLTAHPEVKQELMANPQSFVKSAQQFSSTSNTTTTAPAVKTPLPADPAKPKQ